MEDETAGRAVFPWSLKRRMDAASKISFHAGEKVAVWKTGNLWNIITLEQLKNRGEPIQISEDLAKANLQSEKDDQGKLIQSNDPNELIRITEEQRHYKGDGDTRGSFYINACMEATNKKLSELFAKYSTNAQQLLADQSIPTALRYLLDQSALKKYIIQSYNMAVNNPWSMQNLGGTLLMYTTRDIQGLEEALKRKLGQSQQQLRRKQIEEKARRMGLEVCPRCAGEGGSSTWQASGWTCFECGGFGMVNPGTDGT